VRKLRKLRKLRKVVLPGKSPKPTKLVKLICRSV
jgi:hypothetical protein